MVVNDCRSCTGLRESEEHKTAVCSNIQSYFQIYSVILRAEAGWRLSVHTVMCIKYS